MFRKKQEKQVKQVKCEECKHWIDKCDAQKVICEYDQVLLNNNLYYCPMHKRPYNRIYYDIDMAIKYYKKIYPWQEVDKNGKPIAKNEMTKNDLPKFKQYCEKYIKIFGIDDWNIVYYFDGKDTKHYAKLVGRDINGRVASIWLCKGNVESTDAKLENTAKHEVIHLLLTDFSVLANLRFVTEDELYRAEEALVVKLEKLL